MASNIEKDHLVRSLERQATILRSSIILNPVENFPFSDDLSPASSLIHGLYNTDKIRNDAQKKGTKHQFSGRDRLAYDTRRIYNSWAKVLRAEDLSMRLLSGLHAQTVLFMSLTKPGDKVLLLPEVAGGHMSTKAILERLSLDVIELPVNIENMEIDIQSSILLAKNVGKASLFIDRSEGLNYEDFSSLTTAVDGISIFDGSQYLSNIIAGDYINPFDMGFDLFLSTTHKNFPGPQKALIATKKKSEVWTKILQGISCYVSNMHTFSTYTAGLTISRLSWLEDYSSNMLKNTLELQSCLSSCGVPVIPRSQNSPPTHHIWIAPPDTPSAYKWFKNLETSRILVNYRHLPYQRGTGLRLGLAALTRLGMTQSQCQPLADLIANTINNKGQSNFRKETSAFAQQLLWENV